MKYVLLAGLMVMMAGKSWGQVKVDTIIRPALHDTTYQVNDTLSIIQYSKKNIVPAERVTGELKTYFRKKYIYLTFHFHGSGVYHIDGGDSVNLKTIDDSLIAFHNIGDYELYSGDDAALMYVKLSPADIDRLKNNNLKEVFLQTSNGGIRVSLEGRFQRKIRDIVTALSAYLQ